MNGSGAIEFDEFLNMMAHKMFEEPEPDEEVLLRETFKLFDSDGNGLVSVDDLRRIMTSLGENHLTDDEIREMIRVADTEGKGQINFEEFVKLMTH